MTTDLFQVRANLLARMPAALKFEFVDMPDELDAEARRRYGASLYLTFRPDTLTAVVEIPSASLDYTKEALLDDADFQEELIAAANKLVEIPPVDVWDDSESEWGYADAHFTGTEVWEDQTGMELLKKQLKLDPGWYLMKLVSFDHKKLIEMEQWLGENCMKQFRRVGWSSNCTTKVGVAFESELDAVFFRLRWR